MSHDCDCPDCMETDSRWAPYRRAQRALKEDCPRGVHEPELLRCTIGEPGSAEWWYAHCRVLTNEKGKPKLLPPMKCKLHPRYQGKRKPRVPCEQCHYIWEKNQE